MEKGKEVSIHILIVDAADVKPTYLQPLASLMIYIPSRPEYQKQADIGRIC